MPLQRAQDSGKPCSVCGLPTFGKCRWWKCQKPLCLSCEHPQCDALWLAERHKAPIGIDENSYAGYCRRHEQGYVVNKPWPDWEECPECQKEKMRRK